MPESFLQNSFSLDALLPAEMAEKAEKAGVIKAKMGPRKLFVLGVLAGAFIGLGAIFATTVATGSADLPYGVGKTLVGVSFCLGLVLVVIGGAELFTGNNLIIMAWASKRISTFELLRNWFLVYLGNFFGAVGTAILIFISGQYKNSGGDVGQTMLNIAQGKMEFGFFEAFVLGVLCNVLVCLAVWLTMSARSVTDKVLAIIFPISAFVAAGFEHSVANMYFVPSALFIKIGAREEFWTTINSIPQDYSNLTWGNFFLQNLIPVTLGNIVGGSLLVGIIYWAVYLRKRLTQ